MDEVVAKLEAMTNMFVEQLDTTDVDTMLKFVEERQLLIDEFVKLREQTQLFKNSNEIVADRLRHILSYDTLINEKMHSLMNQTTKQLNKINQSRKREQAYNPAYSADAIYFDKKK
jgi:hypothetical protein